MASASTSRRSLHDSFRTRVYYGTQTSISDDESESVYQSNHDFFFSATDDEDSNSSRRGLTAHKRAKRWSSSERLSRSKKSVKEYLKGWLASAATSGNGFSERESIVVPIVVEEVEAKPARSDSRKIHSSDRYWTIRYGSRLGVRLNNKSEASSLKCWKQSVPSSGHGQKFDTCYFFAFERDNQYRFIKLNKDKSRIIVGRKQNAPNFKDITKEMHGRRAFLYKNKLLVAACDQSKALTLEEDGDRGTLVSLNTKKHGRSWRLESA